jgi:hypothetical protein
MTDTMPLDYVSTFTSSDVEGIVSTSFVAFFPELVRIGEDEIVT